MFHRFYSYFASCLLFYAITMFILIPLFSRLRMNAKELLPMPSILDKDECSAREICCQDILQYA